MHAREKNDLEARNPLEEEEVSNLLLHLLKSLTLKIVQDLFEVLTVSAERTGKLTRTQITLSTPKSSLLIYRFLRVRLPNYSDSNCQRSILRNHPTFRTKKIVFNSRID